MRQASDRTSDNGSSYKKVFEELVADEKRHFDQYDMELDKLKKFGDSYLALQSIERSKQTAVPRKQPEMGNGAERIIRCRPLVNCRYRQQPGETVLQPCSERKRWSKVHMPSLIATWRANNVPGIRCGTRRMMIFPSHPLRPGAESRQNSGYGYRAAERGFRYGVHGRPVQWPYGVDGQAKTGW